jgi:MFS family permease
MTLDASGAAAVYAALLRVPQAPRLLVGALLGRAQLGMAPLAILLLVHNETGSFATAGVAVGTFGGLGAAFAPLQGRLVDRVGQVPVLAVCGTGQPLAFVGLAIAARHGASFPVLLIVSALAGAFLPPLSSCMRALWPTLAPELRLREAAYTLDAVSQELIWTLGPLLVAVIVAVWSASAALFVCAALTAFGVALFVTSALPRSWRSANVHASWAGALTSSRIRVLLLCIAAASVGTGICQVAIPAIAVRAGSAASAGVLLGVWSAGSMLGGIAFGSVRWKLPVEARYRALLLLLAAATVPLVWCRTIPSGVVFSLLAGLPLAALISCQYTLVAGAAPAGALTEAFAWNSAAAFGALAMGSAVGGWLVKQYGLGASFAIAALTAAAASVIAVMVRARVSVA